MDDTSSTYQELIEENALLKQRIQELQASGPSRRQTDAALKEGEARLKETQRITKIGSWEHDLLTNKIAWSNEMYRLFEIDQERFDLSYEVIRDRVHPEDRDTFDAIYTRTLTHLESTQCVHRLLMPDGRVKYIDSRSETYVNSDGKPIRLTGTVQDITEHRRVEESLSKSERKFSPTFHLNPNAMAISDIITSKFIDVNEAFISQTGYSREEIIGNSTEDLQMWVNPDDRKQVINALKEKGEIKSTEVLMRVKNDNIRNVLFSARFIETEQDNYLLTFVLDITDRKQAEEALRRSEGKYRLLYNGMRDGFAYLNMDGTFRESNPAFEEMIGYSLEELRNLTFDDITPEKWRSTDEQALKTLSALGFSNIEEKEYRRKDGAIIPVEVRLTLLLDDQGKPSGIGAIVRDITERKQAEEALRKSEDQFRTIVNNMQDVILRANLNGNITFASPSAAYTMGCSSTEEIIGLRIGSDFILIRKKHSIT